MVGFSMDFKALNGDSFIGAPSVLARRITGLHVLGSEGDICRVMDAASRLSTHPV